MTDGPVPSYQNVSRETFGEYIVDTTIRNI
jgi:hypothetical protein